MTRGIPISKDGGRSILPFSSSLMMLARSSQKSLTAFCQLVKPTGFQFMSSTRVSFMVNAPHSLMVMFHFCLPLHGLDLTTYFVCASPHFVQMRTNWSRVPYGPVI